MTPLRVAIIGMGGFAAGHQIAIHHLAATGACQLVCTCDLHPDAFTRQMQAWEYAGRGVRVFDDYRAMLEACAGELDVVTLPTPVPLHAEMHQACVERGLPVYLEKPPTLDWQELEDMLHVEQRAAKLTNVGFNYIDDPARQALKERILTGEFGPIRKIGLTGLWPRPASYYRRTSWAGRLMQQGRLVLDSCMGNALAHYVHNALFWGGEEGLFSWAEVCAVEAELYRAHAIESADTVFVTAQLRTGTVVQLALTHACDGPQEQQEWVVCERATIHYALGRESRIVWHDGRVETTTLANPDDWLCETFPAYFAYLRGVRDRPTTRLIDARPFVHFCNLTYIAARSIATVPEAYRDRSPADDGASEFVAIRDIRPVIDRFIQSGAFPSRQMVPWGAPGGQASREALSQLTTVIHQMIERTHEGAAPQ